MNARSDFLNNADAFMAKRPALDDRRHITFQDVQVRTAYGGLRDSNNRIGGRLNGWHWFVRPFLLSGTTIHKRLQTDPSF